MDHEGRGVSSLPITRRRVLFLVGAGATAALSGLSWRTARGQAKTVRIGAVTGNFSNPAVKQMVDAMQSELRKYPNAKFFVQDSANVSEQVAKAETMLGQGIDVLGLHPWDGKAIMPLIAKAHSPATTIQSALTCSPRDIARIAIDPSPSRVTAIQSEFFHKLIVLLMYRGV